jgi:hypothetical protein
MTLARGTTAPPGDVRARSKFAVNKNEVIQIGDRLQAFKLGKDNENAADDE